MSHHGLKKKICVIFLEMLNDLCLFFDFELKIFFRATVRFLLTKMPAERIFMVQVPADRALGPNQQFPVQYPANSPDCNLCDSFCFGNDIFFIYYLLSRYS